MATSHWYSAERSRRGSIIQEYVANQMELWGKAGITIDIKCFVENKERVRKFVCGGRCVPQGIVCSNLDASQRYREERYPEKAFASNWMREWFGFVWT